jgi:predicted AlkP superfamily pyrophosphatase or phosphodiesterase
MTLVVLGIDALDADLVKRDEHPNLTLADYRSIATINSSAGEPSTHELWPTIITGLRPNEHGLVLDDGVAWESDLLRYGSRIADYLLPEELQTRIGSWLLNETEEDAFRVPATYYEDNDLMTVFDGREATAIGVPNYVTDPDKEDREHQLRRSMGDLFERDPDATGGHQSSDPLSFYELCLEMAMIRIARTRRALRGRTNELVFGYTSGLDLVGHIAYDHPGLQTRAYEELDEFVGELLDDLAETDELLLVSDHGLQDGVHTQEAMVASTSPEMVSDIDSVTDVRDAIESEIQRGDHTPNPPNIDEFGDRREEGRSEAVQQQLEDLGYM